MGPIRIFWASARAVRPKISEMPTLLSPISSLFGVFTKNRRSRGRHPLGLLGLIV